MLDLHSWRTYTHNLAMTLQVSGDDEHIMYHRACALKSYLIYLVNTSTFVDKSTYYVDVVYLIYFIDLEMNHEYNWGAYLIYLYSKLDECCLWKIKQMRFSCTLMIIYLHPLAFMYHFHNICSMSLLIIHLYHFQA